MVNMANILAEALIYIKKNIVENNIVINIVENKKIRKNKR